MAAVIAGAGGGYLAALNTKNTPPPAASQTSATPATPAQMFPGQGIPAVPAIPAVPPTKLAEACSTVPYHTVAGAITSVSGATADVILYPSNITGFVSAIRGNGLDTANRIYLNSIFKTRAGALIAAGSDYIWSGYRSIPTIYRSIDQGKTWTTASVPDTDENHTKFIYDVAEDSNGVLWAVGMPGVLKSTDDGISWSRINVPLVPAANAALIGETNNDFVRNVTILKDNSVLISVPFYMRGYKSFFAYTNVYKTSDGGATWSILFSKDMTDIASIVEAEDRAIVFTGHDNSGNSVFRFAQGKITLMFNHVAIGGGIGPLLKSRDGTLYWIVTENTNQNYSTETVYRSRDNGFKWQKGGALTRGDYSSTVFFSSDNFIEGGDGSLYLAAYTNCWAATIYRSQNRGEKWEIASGNVPELSLVPGPQYGVVNALEEVGGKVLHGGFFGGVIFSTP